MKTETSTACASFYFYNTKAEVDRFVEVVKEIQKILRRLKPRMDTNSHESV